ncbi:chymotrypsin-like protease CTRL-1 [Echeneis naucrates]|uniref:Chymotrypsin-like protease CTRL-1 n=1 Tax=Echeneis naucrates TaxID=173247 RepID=A0A665UIZ8_ECHNA|nr:chymotrypsin-like protease CTRL-1 [Echeneis naucrates]
MAAWTTLILLTWMVLNGKRAKAQDCGMAPLNTRIVGGENATAGSWPWQVSIHFRESHTCGGTVISDQWVLTAAHCILTSSPAEWTLYFGRVTQSGPNVNEEMRSVSTIIVHPDYNDTLFDNDIALMRLSNPLTFTDFIRPICLASNSSQVYNSTLCWTTGWGRFGRDEPPADVLQEVQIPVIGNNECSCRYRPVQEANISGNMICAGQENKGACQGDSGGPLQCKSGSKWIQTGITSFGVPCARAEFPEVYARVSQFQTWIKDKVEGADVNFVTFSSTGANPDISFECRANPQNSTSAPATTSRASAIATELTLSAILVFVQQILAV